MVKTSKKFVPVFIDTLKDLKTTKRFKESYGSYPVLRVHDLSGKDIAGRIDGNRVAGKIPVSQMLEQFEKALKVAEDGKKPKKKVSHPSLYNRHSFHDDFSSLDLAVKASSKAFRVLEMGIEWDRGLSMKEWHP